MSKNHLAIFVQFNAGKDKNNKNVKFKTMKIHDLYIRDLASGVCNKVPTFLTFAPPGVIEDNKKSAIFHIDPCDDLPNGTIECLIEVDFLKKFMRFELDSALMTALHNSKIVKVGSNYSCYFVIDPLET